MEVKHDDTHRQFYERVYDVLVEVTAARLDDKETFVRAYTDLEHQATEWRFCGNIGFGGKFYRANGTFYVSCYPEERSARVDRILKVAQDRIDDLVKELQPNPYGVWPSGDTPLAQNRLP